MIDDLWVCTKQLDMQLIKSEKVKSQIHYYCIVKYIKISSLLFNLNFIVQSYVLIIYNLKI